VARCRLHTTFCMIAPYSNLRATSMRWITLLFWNTLPNQSSDQHVFLFVYTKEEEATCTCKLLRLLPDRHMVHMIMELVGNRSFTLTIGNVKRSRLRRLKNGVSQGSVLAPILFNICISDTSITVSRGVHMMTI